MCVVCGCGQSGPVAAPGAGAAGLLHFGAGAARVSVPGMRPERVLRIEQDVLGANQRLADHNRAQFAAHGVLALNLVSSPGSGKTTLLCATISALRARAPALPVSVIEGDQQTSLDADRIRASGAPAVQVNTGQGCHLDADMVGQAWAQLHQAQAQHIHHRDHHHHAGPNAGAGGHDRGHDHGHHLEHDHAHDHGPAAPSALLFIENVGNLVCPALWDLGEAAKVAILSVTEGDDKPLKYPDMFAAASLMLLNKTDLLPHVQFDVDRCIARARQVNPDIQVLQLSATRGDGMAAWLDWLLQPGQRGVWR